MTDREALEALRALVSERGHPVTAGDVSGRISEDLNRIGEGRRLHNAGWHEVQQVLNKFVASGLVMMFPGDGGDRYPKPTYAPVQETTSEGISAIDKEMVSLTEKRQRLVGIGILRGTTEYVTPNAQLGETVDEQILDVDRRMIALKRERERLVRIGRAKGNTAYGTGGGSIAAIEGEK